MQKNFGRRNVERIEELEYNLKEVSVPYYRKRELLNFFWNRDYKQINKIEELNELDLVENLFNCYLRHRRFGNYAGMLLMGVCWNTLFKNWRPISKILLGGLVVHYCGEFAVYRAVDQFYNPLTEVFNKRYRHLLSISD